MRRLAAPLLVALLVGCAPVRPVSPTPSSSAGASAAGADLDLSSSLRQAVTADAIQLDLEALMGIAADNGGIRAAGTAGFDASLDYAAALLAAAAYTVTRDEFTLPFFTETAPAEITVSGGPAFVGGEYARAMIFSGSGIVDASVTPVAVNDAGSPTGTGGCLVDDWDDFVAGTIALVGPGPCFRRDQVVHAQEAGAAALVVAYPEWLAGEGRRPTLLRPAGIDIPALSTAGEVGAALRASAAAGTSVHLSVQTTIEPRPTANLIAEIPGRRSHEVVMIGGHLDSVLDGPGINDNGSGTMTALEIALALAAQPQTERSFRIGLWSGEELGLYGSRHYVDALGTADRAQIVAYLNLDMVASPNFVRVVYDGTRAPAGSQELTNLFTAYFDEVGLAWELEDLSGGSDHAPFADAGIPVGGLFSGATTPLTDNEATHFGGIAGEAASPCYHLACDTTEEINSLILDQMADAAAHVIWLLLAGV